MQEIWKDIAGYEGLYQVSNLGNVKSLKRLVPIKSSKKKLFPVEEKILKPVKARYCIVRLSKNGKHQNYSVHRLAASAFIPNPLNLPIINHKDENKQNNNVENLEWCDVKYNSNYGTAKQKLSQKASIPVSQYSLSGTYIQTYESAKLAEEATGISRANICNCCKGNRHSTGGYLWSYDGFSPESDWDEPCGKTVIKYDQRMNVVAKYKSMTKCVKNDSISWHSLSKYANTKTLVNGFYWEIK